MNQILLYSCSMTARFYGHMFKHFVADVVWSGCSVLSVIDSGEKFINGKS